MSIELGALNTTTGAEEASDSFVRSVESIDVTAGLEYVLIHDATASNEGIIFYDGAGDLVSYVAGRTATAPATASVARFFLDTSGVTDFDYTFLPYTFTPRIGVTGSPDDFTWYLGDGTVQTGFEANHNYLDTTVKLVEIYAAAEDWTACSNLDLTGCFVVGTLELTALDTMDDASITLDENPLLSSIIFAPAVSGKIIYFNAYNCSLGFVDFTPLDGCFDIESCMIVLSNNGMSAAIVDHILCDLDLITATGIESRAIIIDGTNAAPTDGSVTGYDGIAAVASLQGKGFTVTITT